MFEWAANKINTILAKQKARLDALAKKEQELRALERLNKVAQEEAAKRAKAEKIEKDVTKLAEMFASVRTSAIQLGYKIDERFSYNSTKIEEDPKNAWATAHAVGPDNRTYKFTVYMGGGSKFEPL